MTPSHDLFELIKSLNKGEKGYFKKYSQLHTVGNKNNYLIVFDAIEKQKKYDEEKILKALSKHSFIKHFSDLKNYLYSRILDSLESYYKNLDVNIKVRREITHAQLLRKRGLYNQSLKIIEKTKKLAREREMYQSLIEISSTLDISLYAEKYDLSKQQQLFFEMANSYSLLKENMACYTFYIKMMECNYGYVSKSKKGIFDAKKILKNDLFKNISKTKSFLGKVFYYKGIALFHFMRGNIKKAYGYEKETSELILAKDSNLKYNFQKYITCINNMLSYSIELGKYDLTHSALQQLNSVSHYARTHSNKAHHFCLYHLNLLHYYCRKGNVAELAKIFPSVISNFSNYTDELSNPEQIELLMIFSVSYYYTDNFKKCMFYLNKARNEFDLSVLPELERYFISFFMVIVHIDSGDYKILPSHVQSFYQFLRKKQSISKMEYAIVGMFRKISGTTSDEVRLEELKQFRRKYKKFQNTYETKYIWKYFDFLGWIDSKIQGRSFSQMVSRK